MRLKEILRNKWIRFVSNTYILVLTIFLIWMTFFDANNWWSAHRELNKEIKKLEQQQKHLRKEIEKDKKLIQQLQDTAQLEKFAREKYYYKKENEEIYLIEFDTLEE